MGIKVKKKSEVLKLIKLMNGKVRTAKIEEFNRLIDWVNKNWNESIDTSKINSNAWFTGFMDADGYFYLYCAKGSVKFSFSLVQKMVNKRTNLSFKPCFEEIANTFDFKLSVIKNWSFLFYFKRWK